MRNWESTLKNFVSIFLIDKLEFFSVFPFCFYYIKKTTFSKNGVNLISFTSILSPTKIVQHLVNDLESSSSFI
jgi:hypothetical protein